MLRKQARVFSDNNMIADFMRGNAELGDIYQLDDRGWVILTNVFKLLPELKVDDYILSTSNPKDYKLLNESSTKVNFSGNGNAGQVADIQAELNFSKSNSAFVTLKQMKVTTLNLEKIKPTLNKLWENNGYNKRRHNYFFVNQVFTAQSGVTIFTEDRNNTVKLQSTLNEKLSSVGTIGSGNVEIVANKKETLEIICNVPHSPLFQAVREKKSGLWETMG